MNYPWKRFWCTREGKMNLSDGGFLYDPDSKYADFIQPDVVPFEKIEGRPCLALLGEPGIGKSTVMEELRDAMEESLSSSNDQLLYINLNEYGNESRLIQDIFKSSKFIEWKKGKHVLHLFIDSLDECKIQIPQVATILKNRFRGVTDHLSRLRLRMACRTADWPATLEMRLPNLWGDKGFEAYELSPLRRKDIEVAAKTEEIDADKFMAEINRTESIPLAIKPVTLDFLLRVFRGHGELPNTRTELYEEGCKLLCEELNPTRQDLRGVGGAGTLSAQERLSIASQIAAVSIFCGKPTIYVGAAIASVSTEQVSISEIAGNPDLPISQAERLSENQIRETLGTGLFSSRGVDLMGFAHQTYAEFLASRYLCLYALPTEKVLPLLWHSGDPEKHIVPQLYEASAWIASQNQEVFSVIASNEPYVLLRCDEGAMSPAQRAELTQLFLDAFNEGRANDRDWDLHRHYPKLAHSQLADQLYPWITDITRHFKARNVAVDISEACKVTSLQSTLADIALNEKESEYLRSNAAHAVAIVGNPDTRRRLLPLAFGQVGKDPEDQLKGNALRTLWPDIISSEELFTNLTLPKRRNFHGSYLHFVGYELAKHLDKKSLPFALQWLEGYAQNLGLGFPFSSLADDIMIAAWRNMDDLDVLRTLASASLKLLECHHDLVAEGEKRSENVDLFDNVMKRRRLAEAMVEQGIDQQNVFLLAGGWCSPRLLSDGDFEWCVQELTASISQPTEPTWASLVWTLFKWAEPSGWMLDMLIDCRAKSAKLKEESASFFTPVVLISEQATKMRKQYEQSQKWQQPKEKKLLDWLPKNRIEHWLTRFEKGEQNVWWVLLRELTLEDTSEKYEHIFDPDIRKLPGWINSDDNTRKRILDASEIYLSSKCSFNQARLLDGSADEQDIAGYKAFLLLMNERLEKLVSLREDVWAYWTPIFFGPFGYNGNREIQKLLISIAYEKVPESVVGRFKQIIRHQIGKEDRYLSVLEFIEDIWDQCMADVVRGLLEEAQAKPLCWERMLRVLLTHGDDDASLLAESKLLLPIARSENDREIALHAALVLIESRDDAAWSVVWPVLQEEQEFGQQVIMELAGNLSHDYASFFSRLSENQLADLYIWLVQQFPYSEDPHYDGGYSPTKEDHARDLRTAVINTLEKAGTPASCRAVHRIGETLTELDWLKVVLIEARKNTLQATWRPLQPEEFLEVTSQPESVLVRNAIELQEVLIYELHELGQLLQGETPAAPALWDELLEKGKFRPKNEAHFSDWVKLNLESKLKKRAIVMAREVQIRLGEGSGTGERTDIHVTAMIPALTQGSYEQVRVIIEVKGCWNPKLKTSMKDQLVDRYLKDNECDHGIYLVGWYVCDQWEKDDRRKTDTPNWSLQGAREFFERQAEELSDSGYNIEAVVINTALR